MNLPTPKTLVEKEAPILLPKLIWFGFGLVAAFLEVIRHDFNNYAIYKGACFHLFKELPLYDTYPLEYFDSNHYGPIFGFLFTPFAVLPEQLAVVLWCAFNIWVLYFAIRSLNLGAKNEAIVFCFGAVELMTSVHNLQINPLITAIIIFSYLAYRKDQVFLGSFFVSVGFLIKLYPIVGLAFILFSNKKGRAIAYFIAITVALMAIPTLLVSKDYLIHQYYGWYLSLTEKHSANLGSSMQNISLAGVLQSIFQLSNQWQFFISALFGTATLLPFLRFRSYQYSRFQLSILASFLITAVVLSSSAESSTYIIAITGVALYLVLYQSSKIAIALSVAALLLTSLGSTDLIPFSVKMNFIRPYKLKALPCILILIDLVRHLLMDDYSVERIPYETN